MEVKKFSEDFTEIPEVALPDKLLIERNADGELFFIPLERLKQFLTEGGGDPIPTSMGTTINTSLGISDIFKPIAIVNTETNCYIDGTPITIEAIDTNAKTIRLSWLPNIPSIASPAEGKNWIVGIGVGSEPSRYGQDQAFIRITGGDLNTRTLSYDSTRSISTFIVGARVYLYNIWANGWNFNFGKTQHLCLVKAGTYYSQMTGSGGVFKHSDGTYRMVVNGYNGTNWQVGLWSSPDLINWTSISDNAKITYAAGTWRDAGIHITSIIKHPTENKYVGMAYGQGGTPFMMRIGWVKFDENMGNIEYSPSEICDTTGTVSGLYEPSIILYNGKYRLMVAARTNSLPDDGWEMWEYESTSPEGPFTKVASTIDTTTAAIREIKTNFRNGHSTETCPFLLNGQLYALICGTSRWNVSANRGERQFGIIAWNDSKSKWDNMTEGIVLGSYQFANSIWNVPEGHVGGAPVLFAEGNKLYWYAALTLASDQYQVIGSSVSI